MPTGGSATQQILSPAQGPEHLGFPSVPIYGLAACREEKRHPGCQLSWVWLPVCRRGRVTHQITMRLCRAGAGAGQVTVRLRESKHRACSALWGHAPSFCQLPRPFPEPHPLPDAGSLGTCPPRLGLLFARSPGFPSSPWLVAQPPLSSSPKESRLAPPRWGPQGQSHGTELFSLRAKPSEGLVAVTAVREGRAQCQPGSGAGHTQRIGPWAGV